MPILGGSRRGTMIVCGASRGTCDEGGGGETPLTQQQAHPESDAIAAEVRHPSRRSRVGLDLTNFFLADVQTGVGPFLAIYLATCLWNPEQVGIALTVGGIAGIAFQTPAGGLVDRVHHKRALIAGAVVCLCAGAVALALWPTRPVVWAAQILMAAPASIFLPAVAAITLGLVGHRRFDRRQGRNQSWNSGGNVVAALSMGLVGKLISPRWPFYLVVIYAIPALLALRLIRADEIDYELARGARDGVQHGRAGVGAMVKNRPLVIFLCCAVLFHFANAAMLPLLGEMLSAGKGASAWLYMSACVITTQAVITVIAWPVGRLAGAWGRKPMLLIGFAALPIRGILYTLTHRAAFLVAIQLLDGIGAGIFGVVSVLVVADLVRGTGRFNITQGAIATAVGLGAALSQAIAGAIVHHAGYTTGFLFLSAVAGVALVVLATMMPETRGWEPGISHSAGQRTLPQSI